MTHRIALLLSYDGGAFAGWQRQLNDPTVQQSLEEALTALCGKVISITGSGRTDSGVHATGQVAHFDSPGPSIPPEKYAPALNSKLPREIRVLKSRGVDMDFHSRYSALRREYGYYLYQGATQPAHLIPYCWGIRHSLNAGVLNRLAEPLLGVHDFSTFAAAGDQSKSRVRDITRAAFIQEGDRMVFRIAGNAFLWRMVRSITGTLLDLAKRGGTALDLQAILESQDREAAGPTAPPRGLFLEKVDYGPKYRFY